VRVHGEEDRQEILVCDGEGGKVTDRVLVEGLVFDLVWLDQQRFVYRHQSNTVFQVRSRDGKWQQDASYLLFQTAGALKAFRGMFWEPEVTNDRRANTIVAVSPNTIAWQRNERQILNPQDAAAKSSG